MKGEILLMMFFTVTFIGKANNGVIQHDDGVTIMVDKNLSVINKREYCNTKYFQNEKIIATSLENEYNLKDFGNDAFYQCVLRAYANHQSVTLAPDMIWLLISQGFGRYVNAHAEQIRPQIVSHIGKKELAIESFKELLSERGDWGDIIGDFASKIDEYTKDDIAETITADFTTTGPSERIASQITLMESLKNYFDYVVFYAGCGIPSIKLRGTPEDWRQVLTKASKLERYGLGTWIDQLRPILQEFINASEGHPDRKFWQQIVKKKRVSKFKGGLCNPKRPTLIDGWLLTLFPDENGKVISNIPFTDNMPSSVVYVGFEYRIVDRLLGTIISKSPMELWAGVLGVEEDETRNMLTPVIGWYVSLEGEK